MAAAVLSAALAVTVVLLSPVRPPPRRPRADPSPAGRRPPAPAPAPAAAGLGGLGVALVVGGPVGMGLGAVTAWAVLRAVRRLEPAAQRRAAAVARADLPIALDLLAVALDAGVPVPRACTVVGEAIGGPVGDRLRLLAGALELGAPPVVAPGDTAWATTVGLLHRSVDSGVAVGGALAGVAADARAAARAAADATARRAGVLVVLPLGLCFLPAFVLVGVVPLVLGVVADIAVP